MSIVERYPGILEATLTMAYDVGGINRDRPKAVVLERLERFLDLSDKAVIAPYEAFFSRLSQEELEDVCTGGEDQSEPLLATAPAGTEEFLVELFQNAA